MAGRTQVGLKVPTVRQRRFVEGVCCGLSDKASALMAGFAPSMAENTRAKLWSKRSVREYFERLIAQAAPPELVVKAISRAIDSKDPAVSLKACALVVAILFDEPKREPRGMSGLLAS